jgi:hypothetical protein
MTRTKGVSGGGAAARCPIACKARNGACASSALAAEVGISRLTPTSLSTSFSPAASFSASSFKIPSGNNCLRIMSRADWILSAADIIAENLASTTCWISFLCSSVNTAVLLALSIRRSAGEQRCGGLGGSWLVCYNHQLSQSCFPLPKRPAARYPLTTLRESDHPGIGPGV